MLNQIIIHGRLTAEAKTGMIKGKNGDFEFATFTVAVNDDKDKDRTTFFKCTAFGKTAEIISEYFAKGQEIIVHGKMVCDEVKQDDDYIDYYWKVLVEGFDFVGKPAKSESEEEKPKRRVRR